MPIENDLPPGVPAYAAGAVNSASVAGFRASGKQDLASYLNPPAPLPAPVAPAQPKIAAQSFLDHAKDFASRAATGIANLFEQPKQQEEEDKPLTSARTAELEGDLDTLQARTTSPSVIEARIATQQ